ncbi:MAG: hypothetical protein LBF23_01665 [Endomicrobium sp.]|jgi:1,4-alpha-glucan branching enzyme|nr:hypothetical protein [Endomicrobium sp.]
MNNKGYWCLQLHAHLPYVRHPEYPDFLEEDWLYEAISETYLPLLSIFEKFIKDGIDFRLTMTITPPLCNMLADTLLQERYYNRLNKHMELAAKELDRTKNKPEFYEVAKMYYERFLDCKRLWEKYNGNILLGYKKLQDLGKIEIITCCATHGFLPLMNNEKAQKAQIKIACQDYQRHFGKRPNGIWLAECAYYSGIDKILAEEHLQFFSRSLTLFCTLRLVQNMGFLRRHIVKAVLLHFLEIWRLLIKFGALRLVILEILCIGNSIET